LEAQKKKRAMVWLKSLEGILLLVLRVHTIHTQDTTEENSGRPSNESNSLCGSSSLSSQSCRDALAARVPFQTRTRRTPKSTKSVVTLDIRGFVLLFN